MSSKLLNQIRNNKLKDFNCVKKECTKWNRFRKNFTSNEYGKYECKTNNPDHCPVFKKMQDETNLYDKETGGFFGCEICKHNSGDESSHCNECCHYHNANTSKYELDKNNGE